MRTSLGQLGLLLLLSSVVQAMDSPRVPLSDSTDHSSLAEHDTSLEESVSEFPFPMPHEERRLPALTAADPLKPGCYVEAWSYVFMDGPLLSGLKKGFEHGALAYFRVPPTGKTSSQRINVQLYCNHGTCPGGPEMVLRLRAHQPDYSKCPLFLLSCDMLQDSKPRDKPRFFTYAGAGKGLGKHVCSTDSILQLLTFFTHADFDAPGVTDPSSPTKATSTSRRPSSPGSPAVDNSKQKEPASLSSSRPPSDDATATPSDQQLPVVRSIYYDLCTLPYPFFLHKEVFRFLLDLQGHDPRSTQFKWPKTSSISGAVDFSNRGDGHLSPYFPQVYAAYDGAAEPVFEYLEEQGKVVLSWEDPGSVQERLHYDVLVPGEIEPADMKTFLTKLAGQAVRSVFNADGKVRQGGGVPVKRRVLGPMRQPLVADMVLVGAPHPVALTADNSLSYIPWKKLGDLQPSLAPVTPQFLVFTNARGSGNKGKGIEKKERLGKLVTKHETFFHAADVSSSPPPPAGSDTTDDTHRPIKSIKSTASEPLSPGPGPHTGSKGRRHSSPTGDDQDSLLPPPSTRRSSDGAATTTDKKKKRKSFPNKVARSVASAFKPSDPDHA